MGRPTFGSLFAGIGGLDLGLERAGWACAFQIENDPYCQRVLAQHWPDVLRWADIREVNPDELPRVDLLAGGFPCQPFSIAGRRRGTADDRWLWPEFARLVRGLRPRYVLVENVPGLLHRGFGDVLGDLAACGYDAEWDCIPAAAVGAPHRRDRVWIVADPDFQGLEVGGARGATHDRSAAMDNPGGRRRGPPHGEVFARGHRPEHASWWDVEPAVGRVADGVPRRVDRLRGLGNAVVPQVAEWIGHRLLAMSAQEHAHG